MRPSRRQMPQFTRPWQAGQTSATAVLVSLAAAAATAQWLFLLMDRGEVVPSGALTDWMGLTADSLVEGRYWQFLTFMLLNAGLFPLCLLASAGLLLFAGREVEPIVGAKHLLGLFFAGNFAGAITHVAAGLAGWIPRDLPLMGISAGAVAVLVAFATILPELEVPGQTSRYIRTGIRAKFLGWIAVGIAAILWASHAVMSLGPESMLAGGLIGWVYVKQMGFGSPLAIQRYLYDRRRRRERLARMPVEQFICEEIDPILDKIAQCGLHSLTRAERKILEQCRNKMDSAHAVEH